MRAVFTFRAKRGRAIGDVYIRAREPATTADDTRVRGASAHAAHPGAAGGS